MEKPKFTIILLLLISLNVPAFAQLKIGFNGGVVLSSLIRENNLVAQDGTVGFLMGVHAKYNLGELGWYVQSGVDYTREGDHIQNLSFIKIPFILGLDASDDFSMYVAYNVAWQVGTHNGVQDFYKDMANIIGLGLEIHVTHHISIGSRLNYGLSNLVDDPAEAKNFAVKPFTFDIYLAYRF